MGTIKFEENEEGVDQGDSIIDACEKLGGSFGCQSGVCHTCKVHVVSGVENFSEKTTAEREAEDVTGDERLACQCKMKGDGLVELKI